MGSCFFGYTPGAPFRWVYFHLSIQKNNPYTQYLEFGLYHPLAQNLLGICTLQQMVDVLPSVREALEEGKAHITYVLLKNGYPKWLVCQFSNPPEKVVGRVDE